MKFNKLQNAAAIEAAAAMLKEHSGLLTSVSSALMNQRSLRAGDTITLHAGLPDLRTGDIEGQPREWLAFRATLKRGVTEIEIYLSLNSLSRGYYASEADCLTVSKKGTIVPDSTKLQHRFGDVALGQIVHNGIEIPFVYEDANITLISVEGYRPLYADGEWTVGDKETLVVAQ